MEKQPEKNLRLMVLLAFAGILIGWFFLEPASGTYAVNATVAVAITCTTPLDGQTNNFGAIDNAAVYNATTSSTTVSSGSTVYMKVYDSGDGAANPGLYKNPDLIRSPDFALSATATLAAGTDGYGMMAATNTVPTAGTIKISRTYWFASTTNIAGGLPYAVGAARTVASTSAAVTDAIIWITYKAAVSATTTAGNYADTITYSCSES